MNNALGFECRKVALKQDRTGFVLTLSVHPDEIPEELLRDFVGARYMCALARINDDETPVPYTNRVKKAGMLCRTAHFHDWLKYMGVLIPSDKNDTWEEKAVSYMYEICEISSRTELNGNKQAQKKFDEMVEEYERWSQEQDPF